MLSKGQWQTWLVQSQLDNHSLATLTEGTGHPYKTISTALRKDRLDEFFVLAVARKYDIDVLETAGQLPVFAGVPVDTPLKHEDLLLALDHRRLVDFLPDRFLTTSGTGPLVKPQKELLRRIWEHYALNRQIKALTTRSRLSRDSLYRQFRKEVSPSLAAAVCTACSVNIRLFLLARGFLTLPEATYPTDPETLLLSLNPRSIVAELEESASMFYERFAPNFDPEEDAGL